MEGACQRLVTGRACSVGIQVRRKCRPARGAQERVEVAGGHGIGVPGIGQSCRLKERAARLQLPQQPLLDGRAAVLVFDVHEVQPSGLPVERLDGGHDAAPIADRGEHAGAGDGGCCGFAHGVTSVTSGNSPSQFGNADFNRSTVCGHLAAMGRHTVF